MNFDIIYTAVIVRGKSYDSIILPHTNKLMYGRFKKYLKIVLMDRILQHGKHPRTGTIAAIKLLETIRVNTHSRMTVSTYDSSDEAIGSDKISLYVDINDKDRVEDIIMKFSFQYHPSNHWNYWLKRWLLAFEDGDDEIIEKPLFKDVNTIKLETNEHEFIPSFNQAVNRTIENQWIACGNDFKVLLTLRSIRIRMKKETYGLYTNVEGNDDLNSISESVSIYLKHITSMLRSNDFDVVYTSSVLHINGDFQSILGFLNTFIMSHPIAITEVKNTRDFESIA